MVLDVEIRSLAVYDRQKKTAFDKGLFVYFLLSDQELFVDQLHNFHEVVHVCYEIHIYCECVVRRVNRYDAHMLNQLTNGLLLLPQIRTLV